MIYSCFDSIPRHRYEVIVADPPWAYRSVKTGGAMTSGSAQRYPVMSIDELCRLPIRELAAPRCALFLWGTVPTLHEYPFRLLKAWGFSYKTSLFWVKTGKIGLGYWFRGEVEPCLLAIRGKVPAFRCQESNTLEGRRGLHSRKPIDFWRKLELAVPSEFSPRLELFATERRAGYDTLSNVLYNRKVRKVIRKEA